MNRKGQALMIGMLVLIMAIIIFVATLPAIKNTMNTARGCDYLNCDGYIDPDAVVGTNCSSQNQTYTSTLEEDELSCTILDLAIPLLILGVLVALITKLIYGKLTEAPPPEVPYYGGGY